MAPTDSPQGVSPEAAAPAAERRVLPPVLTPREPPPLPPPEELGDLGGMTWEALKELCRKYELKVSGTKAQLVARLRQEPEPAGRPPKVRRCCRAARASVWRAVSVLRRALRRRPIRNCQARLPATPLCRATLADAPRLALAAAA